MDGAVCLVLCMIGVIGGGALNKLRTQVASCISVYVPGEYNAQQSRLDHWEVETFKVEVMLLDRSFPSFMDILC